MTYNPESSTTSKPVSGYSAKNICRIVGLVCAIGFIFDMLILLLPPELGNVTWRIGFVQQFANRSIIFLFGMALLTFSGIGISKGRVMFVSRLSMVTGIGFFLVSFLAIADSIQLQKQALENISSRETEIQTQIREAQNNLENLREGVTEEDLRNIAQRLTTEAETRRTAARRTAVKSAVSNVGNLILVGAGLIGLGRSGSILVKGR